MAGRTISRTKINYLSKLLIMTHSPVQMFSGELGVLRLFFSDCTIVLALKFWFCLPEFGKQHLSL